MKINSLLMLVVLNGWLWARDSSPQPKEYGSYPVADSGYVTDLADVLSPQEEDQMESWLYTTEMKKNLEVAVVILRSIRDYPGADTASIESFAKGLFDKYGVGNMPENTGILLLVVIEDRKARIELGAGYGHSRDGDASRIMQDKIVPQFRQGRYVEGIKAGVKGILSEFGGIRIIPGWIKFAVLGLIAAMIPITISLYRHGKRGWGWVCVGLLIILALAFLRLLQFTVTNLPRGSHAGGFGGGFGGGFSGGGGATGSW